MKEILRKERQMDNGEVSWRRFLDGEDEGFYDIVREHKDGLMLFAYRITGDLHDAEDVVQDTFVRLAIKKPRFFGKSSFKTWLYTIARNIAIDGLRRKKTDVELESALPFVDSADSVEEAYLREEVSLGVRQAVRELKPEYAQAIWLVYFEGFSNPDAARVMKKTRHQFENLIYRARLALKRELERRGENEDLYGNG